MGYQGPPLGTMPPGGPVGAMNMPPTHTCFKHVFTANKPGNIEDYYKLPPAGQLLGEGSYGQVCKGVSKSTGAMRAIKSIETAKVTDHKKFEAEVDIQKSLDHPNIVKLYEVFKDNKKVYLVMEICEGGELFDRIIDMVEKNGDDEGAFGEKQAATYMQQIVGAMSYCHKNMIAHRDIKPENFLMQSKAADAVIKIIDFGLATVIKPGVPMTTKAGTPYYVSPQVLTGNYDEKCDVWSCGVIAYILLAGFPPFGGDSDPEILKTVKSGKFEYPSPDFDNVSSSGKVFINEMLTMDSVKRPSFENLLSHTWLNDHADKGTGKLHANLQVNLTKFATGSKFKKLALTCIAQQLKDEDIKELKETFSALDKNNDGTLTLAEIKAAMLENKLNFPPDFENTLMKIDTDASGSIDYTEFIAASIEKKTYAQDGVMWAAFRTFDVDGDGVITKAEIKEMAGKMAQDDTITAMLAEADLDGDGVISFDEFKMLLMSEGPKK